MSVSLVSTTTPCSALIEQGIKTPEDLVVYIARVSNPSNQFNTVTGERLLAYCIGHQHWSPFEQVDMTVEIVTTRAISAQITRHRSFSFQEFSQRYSDVASTQHVELRKQALKNRQSSTEPIAEAELLNQQVQDLQERSKKLYADLLEAGVARECARMVLPLSTTTTLYMKGSLRSWIHYIQLRTKDDSQKEHRVIAIGVKDIFSKLFPLISKSLNKS
jgi:thymidylate synthase (FAD)